MSKTIEFSLDLETTEVTIGGEVYVVKELDGKSRDKYLTLLSKRVKRTGDDASVSNFDGLQSSLLAMCLYQGDELIPEATIQAWPARAVTGLYEIAKDLSKLDEEDKEDGGKD